MTLKQSFPETAAPAETGVRVFHFDYSKPLGPQDPLRRAHIIEEAVRYIDENGWLMGGAGMWQVPGSPVCAVGAINAVLYQSGIPLSSNSYDAAEDIVNDGFWEDPSRCLDLPSINDGQGKLAVQTAMQQRALEIRELTHAF